MAPRPEVLVKLSLEHNKPVRKDTQAQWLMNTLLGKPKKMVKDIYM